MTSPAANKSKDTEDEPSPTKTWSIKSSPAGIMTVADPGEGQHSTDATSVSEVAEGEGRRDTTSPVAEESTVIVWPKPMGSILGASEGEDTTSGDLTRLMKNDAKP